MRTAIMHHSAPGGNYCSRATGNHTIEACLHSARKNDEGLIPHPGGSTLPPLCRQIWLAPLTRKRSERFLVCAGKEIPKPPEGSQLQGIKNSLFLDAPIAPHLLCSRSWQRSGSESSRAIPRRQSQASSLVGALVSAERTCVNGCWHISHSEWKKNDYLFTYLRSFINFFPLPQQASLAWEPTVAGLLCVWHVEGLGRIVRKIPNEEKSTTECKANLHQNQIFCQTSQHTDAWNGNRCANPFPPSPGTFAVPSDQHQTKIDFTSIIIKRVSKFHINALRCYPRKKKKRTAIGILSGGVPDFSSISNRFPTNAARTATGKYWLPFPTFHIAFFRATEGRNCIKRSI